MLGVRRRTLGYVSQFLRVDPARAGARDRRGAAARNRARPTRRATRAGELLASLNVPERLWELPPATFSGGEQQRVNIARGFIARASDPAARRADRLARCRNRASSSS